jgi:SAM-dependent methyltransferase
MNALVTGRAYVEAISALDADRAYRAAFVDLALSLVAPRARIFDFGCGPGLDASAYLARGHEVHAYDIDADMCATFRETCGREMLMARAHLVEGTYDAFLASASEPVFDLVTANFAPVNLVPAPAALFRKFAALLKPGGHVLVSVLNPLYRGDLRYAWWWAGLPRLLARGHYSVPGAQAPITRWLPGELAAQAGAAFGPSAIYSPSAQAGVAPRRMHAGNPADRAASCAARFLFLQLQRAGA